jgi:hypothetical protein
VSGNVVVASMSDATTRKWFRPLYILMCELALDECMNAAYNARESLPFLCGLLVVEMTKPGRIQRENYNSIKKYDRNSDEFRRSFDAKPTFDSGNINTPADRNLVGGSTIASRSKHQITAKIRQLGTIWFGAVSCMPGVQGQMGSSISAMGAYLTELMAHKTEATYRRIPCHKRIGKPTQAARRVPGIQPDANSHLQLKHGPFRVSLPSTLVFSLSAFLVLIKVRLANGSILVVIRDAI